VAADGSGGPKASFAPARSEFDVLVLRGKERCVCNCLEGTEWSFAVGVDHGFSSFLEEFSAGAIGIKEQSEEAEEEK